MTNTPDAYVAYFFFIVLPVINMVRMVIEYKNKTVTPNDYVGSCIYFGFPVMIGVCYVQSVFMK